ncbi:MAG: DUF4397 domain-containing protein [Anaerolineae bacterium]|nr:DUF4397 domain-containing protein [Anaerolineae bacterium]
MLKSFLFILVISLPFSVQLLAQTDPVNLGEVRVVNALVGLGDVDVYLDGSIVAYNLAPEDATIYFATPPGRHSVAVRLAGNPDLSVPLADVLIDLAANGSQTAIVYQDKFALEDGSYQPPLEEIGSFIVLDDNRSLSQLGQSRLTAVHLSVGTPGKLSVAYTNRASLLHEIELEKPYGTIDIDAGVYQLALVDAESESLDILERMGQFSFNSNTLYTVVTVPNLVPQFSNSGSLMIPTIPATPRAFLISASMDKPADGFQVRMVHAAHNTAVVDLYVDERLVVPRMNFGQYTEYIGLSDFSHTVTLRRRDAAPDDVPLAVAQINITDENRDQEHWTLLLLNANEQSVNALNLISEGSDSNQASPVTIETPGGPLVLVLLPDNVAQTSRDSVRVRLIHAIDGALDLSLYTPALPTDEPSSAQPADTTPQTGPTSTPAPPVQLVDSVLYGAEANETETRAGLYDELEFIAGGVTTVYSMSDVHLIDGIVYTFVLIGQPAGEPPVTALQIEDFGRGIPQERLYRGLVTANVEQVNVREGDDIRSPVQGSVANGTSVDVLGRNQDGSWVLIRYTPVGEFQQREGWISASLILVTRLGDPANVLSLPQIRR